VMREGQAATAVNELSETGQRRLIGGTERSLAWIPTLRYRSNVCDPPSPIYEEVFSSIS
jgi:hypothetical protein